MPLQVGARPEKPHTAAAPPRPTNMPLSPGEARGIIRKIELGAHIIKSWNFASLLLAFLLDVLLTARHSEAC